MFLFQPFLLLLNFLMSYINNVISHLALNLWNLSLNHVYFGIIKSIWKPFIHTLIKLTGCFLLDCSIHDRYMSEWSVILSCRNKNFIWLNHSTVNYTILLYLPTNTFCLIWNQTYLISVLINREEYLILWTKVLCLCSYPHKFTWCMIYSDSGLVKLL